MTTKTMVNVRMIGDDNIPAVLLALLNPGRRSRLRNKDDIFTFLMILVIKSLMTVVIKRWSPGRQGWWSRWRQKLFRCTPDGRKYLGNKIKKQTLFPKKYCYKSQTLSAPAQPQSHQLSSLDLAELTLSIFSPLPGELSCMIFKWNLAPIKLLKYISLLI